VIHQLLAWYYATLSSGGYPLVVLFMAMESSVIPLPAEMVVPFAAYSAHSQGHMTVVGVVIAATIGSWLGATIMYWASRWAGRPLVLRYGSYFLISPEKVEAAERWSARFGGMGVFVSRLLPVIRHLIGIPSGIVRIDYFKYSLYTLAGSAIWSAVLAWVGVVAGQNQDIAAGDMKAITIKLVIPACLLLGGLYYFFVYRLSRTDKARTS
jgi:membrane protein DedA with SNARE-associated domain